MTLYECENGHLRRDVSSKSHPDGSFAGRECVECGAPAAICVE